MTSSFPFRSQCFLEEEGEEEASPEAIVEEGVSTDTSGFLTVQNHRFRTTSERPKPFFAFEAFFSSRELMAALRATKHKGAVYVYKKLKLLVQERTAANI